MIKFCNKNYTEEDFINEFFDGDYTVGTKAINALLSQGKAVKVEESMRTKESRSILKALEEDGLKDMADVHDLYDEMEKDFNKEKQRAGRMTYPKIELDFGNVVRAQEFEEFVKTEMRLETKLVIQGKAIILEVMNPTDSEYNTIVLRYKADNTVKKVLSVVDKTATGATDAVNYASTKVLVPTVQVGAKAGASILKTLFSTTAKATGTVISALAQGTKDCYKEVTTDADVLRAGRDLLEVKNTATRSVKSMSSNMGGGSGIRVTEQ